jgi:hypothetical protein
MSDTLNDLDPAVTREIDHDLNIRVMVGLDER